MAESQAVAVPQPNTAAPEVLMQDASLDIWDKKYRLKAKDGRALDQCVDDTLKRVARALAGQEAEAEQGEWYSRFLWALRSGAIPAGRILANAGAEGYKNNTSLINCTVAGTIPDSMAGILASVTEAGLTLTKGSGIGYDFSTIRPRGAWVRGAGAQTSGVVPFMDIYDQMCATISSSGGRRGAQMGVLDIQHPDCLEFIEAKRQDGRLRNFNLSLLITHAFIEAVKADGTWPLVFPLTKAQAEAEGICSQDTSKYIWRTWPSNEGYLTNDTGLVACKVYKTVKAKELWAKIMRATYDFADPGFLLIDEVNEQNNLWWCEEIRASNP